MTDIEIASTVKLKPITEIAKKLGIDPEVIELYGKYKAEIGKILRTILRLNHVTLKVIN